MNMNGKNIDKEINQDLWDCVWSTLSKSIYDITSKKVSNAMYSKLAKSTPDLYKTAYLVQEEIENATYH